MPPNDKRIDARDWSLLAVLSVLWGGSFFFNGMILRELPPLTLVLLRVVLGTIILLPLLLHGDAAHAFDRSIDNQVSRLRRKIETDSRNPQLIQTVWGDGYMLAADVRR